MRDPARIERIMPLLQEVWSMMPDWRLGQLISNAAVESRWGKDPYYMEDIGLEEILLYWKEKWKED